MNLRAVRWGECLDRLRHFRISLEEELRSVQSLSLSLSLSSSSSSLVENYALLGYYTASSRNFLTTFRNNLLVPSSGVKNPFGNPLDSWSLKIGPIGCIETSLRNYDYSLRNSPEERSSHLIRGGSLKSRHLWFFTYSADMTSRRPQSRAAPSLQQLTVRHDVSGRHDHSVATVTRVADVNAACRSRRTVSKFVINL